MTARKTSPPTDGVESLLASALESTADGILIVDSEGKFRCTNRKFAEIWQVPENVIQAGDDAKALSYVLSLLKYPEAFLQRVNYLYAHPEEQSFDVVEFKDGRIIERYSQPHRHGPQILGRVWSFRDVTSWRQLDRMLAEAQRLANIGSWESDKVNQKTIWSDGLYLLFGLDPRNPGIVPSYASFLEFVHPEDRDLTHSRVIDSLERNNCFEIEFRLVKATGDLIYVKSHGEQIVADDGRVLRLCGIVQDITAQKIAEREKAELLANEKRARAEAERVNSEKDLFLATLSHELRTPLTSILMWAQMLKTGRLGPQEIARASHIIEQSAKTQSQLINDILDVSRIILGKLSLEKFEADPAMIVQSAIDLMRPTAQSKGIAIEADLERNIGTVHADPARLQQVITNLVANAIKFSSPEASIAVELKREVRAGQTRLVISISDHGVGIEPQFLPYIFDRFTQADNSSTRSQGGLGLGLAIVQNLVRLHEGTVEVESAGTGQGATFRVILPLASGVSSHGYLYDSRGEEEALHDTVQLQGIKVLLVDDDCATREACTMTLTSFGANVIAATSAAEALQFLNRYQPDLLLADIAMPEEDGISLITKIRKLEPDEGANVPSVALTAYAGPDDRKRILAGGFDSYLAKPVNAAQLVRLVNQMTERLRMRAVEAS